MNNIVVNKLEKEDLKEAIAIYDINHKTKTNYDKLLKQYDDIYNNPVFHNIVAKKDGRIVGLATVVLNYDIVEELKPFLTVWNVGVHKDYRRCKVGTALLNYVYDYAKKLNCDFVALIADSDNKQAHAFYESLGYEKYNGYVKIVDKG